jgi:hypothetical protein
VCADNRSEHAIITYLIGLRQAEAFLPEQPDQVRCTDERERAGSARPPSRRPPTASLEAFWSKVLAPCSVAMRTSR